ncbi:polyketide synthase [Streptomyces sp. SL13]|uniref:Polyketide synthase n=1 Tax=Streptantibioticus silvisoli TaxID=2705255 RepID=A0AA90H8F6_9ACTN|nr:polyketide synthase [Streptantibioticus silvisoli]MDI5970745.1 polyketide synthase [Streptantibioticus silvisoli]
MGVALPGDVRSLAEFEHLLYAPADSPESTLAFADHELLIDPVQFAISPRQARFADPQHLLLLDVARRAFEDAGLPAESLRGSRTGVYVGMTESDHLTGIDLADVPESNLSSVGVGNNRGVAAGRISYAFDLHGPSMQLDSTCSSGLLALHLAAAALRDGEVDRALVVASHLVRSDKGRTLRRATGAMDPASRCNAFTDHAAGFVVGEGVIAFVLEPETTGAAPAGGGYARVASAANHDGRTAGLAVPNKVAQEDVVTRARQRAGVGSDEVVYVEAHGTGTKLGDPIEVQALATAYETATRNSPGPLLIGSNKPRFGHLEAASGLLSLLVGVCVLRTARIPGTRSQGVPSPLVDWAGLNIALVQENTALPDDVEPVLGVSAFGMSGTNVHAIVAPARAPRK